MDAEPNENGPVLTLLVRLAVLALGVEVTIAISNKEPGMDLSWHQYL